MSRPTSPVPPSVIEAARVRRSTVAARRRHAMCTWWISENYGLSHGDAYEIVDRLIVWLDSACTPDDEVVATFGGRR